jgi:hypothetical protein
VPFGADQVEGRNLIAGPSAMQRPEATVDIHRVRILETREANKLKNIGNLAAGL